MGVTERYNRINSGFNADVVNPISEQIDKTKFPGYTVKGGLRFAGVGGASRSPVATDWNNVQIRIGAAYRLNEQTVLRGGYGTFYQNPTSFGNQFGFSQTTSYVATLDSGRTSANKIDNPFPDGLLPPTGASLGLRTFLGQAPNFLNTAFQDPLRAPVFLRYPAPTARQHTCRCLLCRLPLGAAIAFEGFQRHSAGSHESGESRRWEAIPII